MMYSYPGHFAILNPKNDENDINLGNNLLNYNFAKLLMLLILKFNLSIVIQQGTLLAQFGKTHVLIPLEINMGIFKALKII